MKNEKLTLRLMTIVPIAPLILISIFLLVLFYQYEQNKFSIYIKQLRHDYVVSQKQLIKDETLKIIKNIRYAQKALKKRGLSKSEIKSHLLEKISTVRFGKNGYFFIYDYNGVNLMHPIKKHLVGKNLYDLQDKNGVYLLRDLIESAQINGRYVNYVWDKPDTNKPANKIGYALGIDEWQWMIGTGVYIDDIDKTIVLKQEELAKNLEKSMLYIVAMAAIIILIAVILVFILINKISEIIIKYQEEIEFSNKNLESEVNIQTQQLKDVNENLEHRIEEEIHKVKEQEKALFEQAKMAQMGEMIGNIAHQWRQPLSAISTAVSGVKVNKEFGILEDDELLATMDAIMARIQYLSETIDTFSNFVKEGKEVQEVVLQDRIDRALHIIKDSLESNSIEVKNNIDYSKPINIIMVIGELPQVIINILTNAKDIIKERGIENGWVEINLEQNDKKAVITIEDNAGGVPEDIINKIFDPYFTTKHQSQGTGLGLHMSYEIITKSLLGEISVENTSNGAKFTIILPLDRRGGNDRRELT